MPNKLTSEGTWMQWSNSCNVVCCLIICFLQSISMAASFTSMVTEEDYEAGKLCMSKYNWQNWEWWGRPLFNWITRRGH